MSARPRGKTRRPWRRAILRHADADLGDDNLRKLLIDQKAMLFAQQQQVVDAMARATAWPGIGPSVSALIAPYVQAGAIKVRTSSLSGNSRR